MDQDRVEVNKHAKKERGQYQAILAEQAWSIKDLLCGFWENFSCGTRRVVPSGQNSSILPARYPTRVANHSTGFDSSFDDNNNLAYMYWKEYSETSFHVGLPRTLYTCTYFVCILSVFYTVCVLIFHRKNVSSSAIT